jgi:hypothetical protein
LSVAEASAIEASAIEAFAADIAAGSGSREAVDALAAAYRAGAQVAGVPGNADVTGFLVWPARQARDTRELVAIVAHEGPQGCPGFTGPAIQALARYIEDPPPPRSHRLDATWKQHALVTCLLGPYPAARYERLRPLCQELGRQLIRPALRRSGVNLSVSAIETLGNAPAAALSGPLRSWVDTYTQLLDAKLLRKRELDALRLVVAGATNPKRAAALTPITDRMRV